MTCVLRPCVEKRYLLYQGLASTVLVCCHGLGGVLQLGRGRGGGKHASPLVLRAYTLFRFYRGMYAALIFFFRALAGDVGERVGARLGGRPLQRLGSYVVVLCRISCITAFWQSSKLGSPLLLLPVSLLLQVVLDSTAVLFLPPSPALRVPNPWYPVHRRRRVRANPTLYPCLGIRAVWSTCRHLTISCRLMCVDDWAG